MGWMSSLLGHLDSYDGLADWIHTLVAILGLIVTICLASTQVRREQKSEMMRLRLRARSLALAMFPELLELKLRIHYLVSNIRPLLASARNHQLYERLSQATVAIPPVLARSVDRMHVLGEAAGSEVQQLVAILNQYNRVLELLETDLTCNGAIPEGYFLADTLLPHLEAAQQLIANSIELVGQIQEGEWTFSPA